MVRRKESEIGSARAHPGAPHNQKFNVSPKYSKKRKTWWNGYTAKSRKADD